MKAPLSLIALASLLIACGGDALEECETYEPEVDADVSGCNAIEWGEETVTTTVCEEGAGSGVATVIQDDVTYNFAFECEEGCLSDVEAAPILMEVSPADGATGAGINNCVTAEWWGVANCAVLTVESGGETYQVELTEGANELSWCPEEGLEPDAAYLATLVLDGDDTSWSWTTSDLGLPTGGDAPTSSVYTFESAEGVFMVVFNPDAPSFSIGFQGGGGGDLDLRIGLGTEDEQDECGVTTDLSGTWSDPVFEVGPDDVTFPLGSVLVPDSDVILLEDFHLTGTLYPDLSGFAEGELSYTLDVRSLPWDSLTDSPEEYCEMFDGFGVTCTACSDGKALCINEEVSDVTGLLADYGELEVRTVEEVQADEECD